MPNRPWVVEEARKNMNKKTMLAISALCATVAIQAKADDTLVSSDIVGYQLIKVPTGYTLFTPTFDGVNAELDLTSIEICDSTGAINESLYNDVGVQKMDTAGAYLDVYSYSPDFGGWNVDFAAIEAGDVTFKVGETICVANDSGADVYFRVSGKVDLVNKNEVGQGFVLWGNSTPVKIDLTQVSVVDSNGDVMSSLYNDVGVQKMDDTGAYLDVVSYSPDFGGWNIDFTAIEEGDFTLEPGEAVCVANDCGSTVYFKLPCPVKK